MSDANCNKGYYEHDDQTAAGVCLASMLGWADVASVLKHYDLDHEALFKVASTLTGGFLMTYDDADGVRALATEQRFDIELVFMKNTHHTKMTELLIGRDLDWVRDKELSLFDQEAV